MTETIVPRYKLMMFYDLIPQKQESYYQFVMTEMTPLAQRMGLHIFRVYHTLWGDYPLRQAEFVAEDLDTIRSMLASEQWQAVENKLLEYATNYTRKIVRYRPGFQF